MFRFNDHKIEFKHFPQDREACRKTGKVWAELTLCQIFNEAGEIVATGEAKCSMKDNFSRVEGRKLSFERAMHKLVPNTQKAERLNWWLHFFVSDDGKKARPVF